MKSIFFTAALLFMSVTGLYAQATNVEGQGRFHSLEDDSVTFIRSQLLFAATRDALSKEMQSMGLDAQGFWQQFEQQFEASFAAVDDELRQKHKIDQENVTARQRQAYEQELRTRKLTARTQFGSLARAMSSYSIKNQSRSTQGNSARYMSIQARIDRRALNSIYSDFMREGRARYFQSLYLTVNVELNDGVWSDLGVGTARDFTSVLENHWKTLLDSKLTRQVGAILVTDDTLQSRLQDYLKIPVSFEHTANVLELNEEGEAPAIASPMMAMNDSLWLRINLKMTKTDEDLLLGTRAFRFQGDLILVDLRTHRVLHSFDFPIERHAYSSDDLQTLSSSIATLVARQPIGEFDKMPRTLSNIRSDSATTEIELKGMRSVKDYYSFSQILAQKGLTLDFSSRLKSFNGREALIQLEYKGDTGAMLEVLKGLNFLELESSVRLGMRSERQPFIFEIVPGPTEEL